MFFSSLERFLSISSLISIESSCFFTVSQLYQSCLNLAFNSLSFHLYSSEDFFIVIVF